MYSVIESTQLSSTLSPKYVSSDSRELSVSMSYISSKREGEQRETKDTQKDKITHIHDNE